MAQRQVHTYTCTPYGEPPGKPFSVRVAALLAAVLLASPTWAGPPFLTDDPTPVEKGHWEVYGFTSRVDADEDTGGTLAGVEVNYGAARNLQLHLIVPLAFDKPPDTPSATPLATGLGDIELGVKYRLIEQAGSSWRPSIGVFPLLEVPTGQASRGLGEGSVRGFIPVWLERDFGPWTTYGGGGLWLNTAEGKRNSWFVGWMLQRQITHRLALGGEVFHQTADDADEPSATGFNIGAIYDFSEHYHLLLSAGRGLHNLPANRFAYYIALQHTF